MSEERTPEEIETGLPPFLDTNCIVRYLTDDPPEMAEKAALVIDGNEPLIVSELVVAETAYVLESVYEYEREELVDDLVSFIQRQNPLSGALMPIRPADTALDQCTIGSSR